MSGDLGLTPKVGQQIRSLRGLHRLTQDGLANAMTEVGVPTPRIVIAKLETGRRPFLTVDELMALCKVFGATIPDILGPVYEDWWIS